MPVARKIQRKRKRGKFCVIRCGGKPRKLSVNGRCPYCRRRWTRTLYRRELLKFLQECGGAEFSVFLLRSIRQFRAHRADTAGQWEMAVVAAFLLSLLQGAGKLPQHAPRQPRKKTSKRRTPPDDVLLAIEHDLERLATADALAGRVTTLNKV